MTRSFGDVLREWLHELDAQEAAGTLTPDKREDLEAIRGLVTPRPAPKQYGGGKIRRILKHGGIAAAKTADEVSTVIELPLERSLSRPQLEHEPLRNDSGTDPVYAAKSP